MSRPLLVLDQVTLRFGGLVAVDGVELSLSADGLHGLIGPNGAGKTTVFNLITGVYTPSAGAIWLDGRRVDGLSPRRLVEAGIARTFQNIRLFRSLTVREHVLVASNLHRAASPWAALGRFHGFRADEAALRRRADELLELFDLLRVADAPAAGLPYGDQRRLEIVRALATRPRLLLLDEPAAGLNPAEKLALVALIRRVRQEFCPAILLVEHSMRVVMGVCERIAVLDHGKKIAEGGPEEIRSHPAVIEAYLGPDHAASLHHH